MDVKGVLLLCISITSAFGAQELKLVHVIFAHKMYAPITDTRKSNGTNFPSNLTYEYFNERTLDMSNSAKLNMYDLGVYLRERYDAFLGDIYMTEHMKMRTSEFPLSMIAGQLVNAGLWPPRGMQKWTNNIQWQPVPSDYEPLQKDALLMSMFCPNFKLEVQRVLQMDEIQKRTMHHEALFKHISEYTGRNVSLPSDVALTYSYLEMQVRQETFLPAWTDGIFPDGEMYNVTLLEYDVLSKTLFQRQLNGGVMLKEILSNSVNYIQGDLPKERKMMLYSGDERNLVAIFKNLNLWTSPHIPGEASTLIFEMHFDNETQVYGIKLIYYTGIDMETIPLVIPGCDEICPIDKFKNIVSDFIPTNEEILCGWPTSSTAEDNSTPNHQNASGTSTHNGINPISLAILLISTLYLTK